MATMASQAEYLSGLLWIYYGLLWLLGARAIALIDAKDNPTFEPDPAETS